jgi:hypothetical protein
MIGARRLALAAVAVAVLALAGAASAAAAASSGAAVDPSPLAANGFASPSCTSEVLTAALSPSQRENCDVSGVDVAPVPLSNYAIDVNIPSGLDASVGDDLYTVVQDLLVTPVWTAIVWLVHVVLVALEWCYALDLLAPATLARVSSSLGVAQRVFTDPWLGLALAIAAVGFAWQGLVRRRVLDTLGQAALLAVMVCCGLWIIADPVGTVGALGGLADRAALTTVAASATDDPSRPVSSVDAAFAEVFSAAIAGPWCYLEFGDVNWCLAPAALDPRLRATADRLEAQLSAEATCRPQAVGLVQCAPGGSALQAQLSGAATALREARTNGELFLALPPDALARDALSTQTVTPTLYGTLCGSPDPTNCTAATAPQAEFRTASGTWPRVGGLLLIVAGTLGMLLLLGFIALRLIGAALATLIFLLLAPLAVLAPALGEAGRRAFTLWLTRLLGAALSKLVYSVALGVVLLIVNLLASLDELGWWTQWLLTSVFWWTAFEQRHRMLSLVMHERGEPARRAPLASRAWLGSRRAGSVTGGVRASGQLAFAVGGMAAEAYRRTRRSPQEVGALAAAIPPSRRDPPDQGGGRREGEGGTARERRAHGRAELADQVQRVRGAARGQPAAGIGGERPASRPGEIAGLELRRTRIAHELSGAERAGNRRRAVSLRRRAIEVDAAIALASRSAPSAARAAPLRAGALAASRLRRVVPTSLSKAVETRRIMRTLNAAATASGESPLRGEESMARLAGLAGIAPAEYRRRGPAAQRAARLEVERELTRRRQLLLEQRAGLRRGRGPDSRSVTAVPADTPAGATLTRRARQFGQRQP